MHTKWKQYYTVFYTKQQQTDMTYVADKMWLSTATELSDTKHVVHFNARQQ